MSTAQREREFDARVTAFVDAFVAADGVAATEQRLQARFGDPDADDAALQEALAYLRREHRGGAA